MLSTGSPVVVDINCDGLKEIFVPAPAGDRIHGFDSTLTPLPGWLRVVSGAVVGGVTVTHDPRNGGVGLFAATAEGVLCGLDAFGWCAA